jgi:hypothetical protein
LIICLDDCKVEEHRSDSCCCCLFGLICLAFMLAVRFASTHWSTQTDRETCRQQMVPQYANVPFKVRVLYNSQSRNGLSWAASPYVVLLRDTCRSGLCGGRLSYRVYKTESIAQAMVTFLNERPPKNIASCQKYPST